MSSAAKKMLFTPQQYLAIEREAEGKHEFYRGEISAMAGASLEHNRISRNLNYALGRHLGDGPCEVFSSEMRVKVDATSLYTYPDLLVACAPLEFEDSHLDVLLNPTVFIEILSPSTESYDRGKKFAQYRTISTLRDYVLISQDAPLVERYTRRGEEWCSRAGRGSTIDW